MYILDERNSKRYEIVGNLKFQKEFEKAQKKIYSKYAFNELSGKEFQEYQNHKELSEDRKAELEKRMMLGLLDAEDKNIELVRETLLKMICQKNFVERQEVENVFAYLDETYGEDVVNERFEEILKEVFTQVGVSKREMPKWE